MEETRCGGLDPSVVGSRIIRLGGLESILNSPSLPIHGLDQVETQSMIAIGRWYLWWLRRQTTHDERVPLRDHWLVSVLPIAAKNTNMSRQVGLKPELKWSKPNPGFLKLNVNASFYEEPGMGSTAAILRNTHGTFVVGKCTFYQHVANAGTTEALAMKDGLHLANSLGATKIQAKFDYMEVINFCKGQMQWWDSAAAVYADCVETALQIGTMDFKHVPREANGVAHELACFSFHNNLSCTCDDEPSSCLLACLAKNVNIIPVQ